MRVVQHDILMQAPELPTGYAGAGGLGMPHGRADDGTSPPRAGVSVFRPGRPLLREPVAMLQKGRDNALLPQLVFAAHSPHRIWEQLVPAAADPAVMARNSLFPDHGAQTAPFDLLRSRLMQAMAQRGWRTLGVAGIQAGAGGSFLTANLALSLARLTQTRSILLDLDLAAPCLAGRLGLADIPALGDVLTGAQPFESQFRRLGSNLALGLNGVAVGDPGAVLAPPEVADVLTTLGAALQPDVILADLPPVLDGDAFTAVAPWLDAVLLVVDGTRTTAADIKAAEARIEGRVALMGTILNRAQGRG